MLKGVAADALAVLRQRLERGAAIQHTFGGIAGRNGTLAFVELEIVAGAVAEFTERTFGRRRVAANAEKIGHLRVSAPAGRQVLRRQRRVLEVIKTEARGLSRLVRRVLFSFGLATAS